MRDRLDEVPPEPLQREATGNAEVLEDLVARVTPALVGLARIYRIPAHEIEDLVQTVWMVAGVKRRTIENLGCWACETMKNRCRMYWRSKRIEQRMSEGLGQSQGREDEVGVLSLPTCESRIDLGRILLELPPEQRRAVVLYAAHGLSAREVAEVTGLSAANVRQIWRRVRGRLVESLCAEVGPTEEWIDG